ncbi:MAG: acyl-phosphate glycerol 3-phosphate acyltransferase [Ignavibacteria bacterium GWA2_55_11]|nr:MAG: acyl-phosphate glycerol 3-phosphate acyltransferase [Ignavibacteria bacterium GWA2_55_11]OGU44011.1 MAG: acyl-phosphate glycerol 3-phosphate acyltransferase [Ignavibacteria bacterium GWC2_56_12]OGU62777.1 MAG: acyl-phosphate glycerol 3-phosphate acyltransferase [Ignavibacteria bacterium RIFCSPHIGHO2_02_FULL_56_12]OGU72700.1 MAG: acyl-phosphate glycerol 3-phosphate acyltransferase [Ignavibacteria bacterium RIFCSPLOWO2_12_FULL_56_21]HAV22766.1 acyl-phosphate glycerol 3-phosphate acyltrans
MLNLLIVVLLSYIVGSIPTSIMMSRWRHGFDIRTKGSGNAGGTNVFRVLGWKSGIVVMGVDLMKGVLATTVIARLFWDPTLPFYNRTPFDDFTIIQMICGGAAIVGHVWTVFAGFRGGKGIATGAGMLIGIAPTEFAVSVAVFLTVLYAYRYVSLGSIAAAIAFPLSILIRHNILSDEIPSYRTLIFFSAGVALFLVYSHRSNIKRLLAGTENKISDSSGNRSAES